MSTAVYGFKNLISRQLLIDQSIMPLLKKSEQYKKVTQTSIDHFQVIVRGFENYYQAYDKSLSDFQDELEANSINIPQFYNEYVILFRHINAELKIFGIRTATNFKQLTTLCSTQLMDFSNLILTFQQSLRQYQNSEQILFEVSKKYYRTHKTMVASIQSYKSSFTDVKLIYNMDEKNKRYFLCESTFKCLNDQLNTINDKVEQLSLKKDQITEIYRNIEKELVNTLKNIGARLIAETKNYVCNFCQLHKIIITFLAQRKFTLEKIELKTFFVSVNNFYEEDLFNCEVDAQKCDIFPSFLVYRQHIREDCLTQVKTLFGRYVKEITERTDQRKFLNKKVIEFTVNFFKMYEKAYLTNLKQVIASFEKLKLRVSQTFGNRLLSFLKSINSIFELSIGITEKLIKRVNAKLKVIEQHLLQQGKLLQLFSKQLKSNTEKFVKKKQTKRPVSDKQPQQQQQQSVTDLQSLRRQYQQKSQYVVHLIYGFIDKMRKNCELIKMNYNAVVNDISLSINQFYSLCCEYQQMYFGQEEYVKNLKKYQVDINAALAKETEFFQEINFSLLVKEVGKIVFEAEYGRVEEFKKIKKPIEIEHEEKPNRERLGSQTKEKTEPLVDTVKITTGQKQKQDDKSPKNNMALQRQLSFRESVSIESVNNKYQQFLASKIVYVQDQKFIKSFSCGFTDKIILTGRLYITTNRLCFHSKFNPSTVFFGQTFIQIPKKDIKKIEKRHNAIFFDNSISVTTVNGEMFFTSFFSRNEAYELMCNTLDIHADDFIYELEEPEQITAVDCQILIEKTQEDDMKEQTVAMRLDGMSNLLCTFQYKTLLQTEFAFKGLNALKMFKMFDSAQQVKLNRKTYPSFLHYYKEVLGHTDFQIGEWTPDVSEFINSVNLKEDMPTKINRKIFSMVPIANSGVPFMPKAAKSDELQCLFFFSKNKYIIESMIQNSGAPYTDCFNIRLRRIVESVQENKCRMTVQLCVHFTQKTIMRSVIESKTIQDSKIATIKMEQQIKKYLKTLEKKARPQVEKNGMLTTSYIRQSSSQVDIDRQQQTSEYKTQLIQTQKQLTNSKMLIQRGKKLIKVLVLLNIFFLVLLIQ